MDVDDELRSWKLSKYRAQGLSEEEISGMLQKEQDREDIYLYKEMIKTKAWQKDISVECSNIHICLAGCLERCFLRRDAIQYLRSALSIDIEEIECSTFHDTFSPLYKRRHRASLLLALAKLLFKDDCKTEALNLCKELMDLFGIPHSVHTVSIQQASEAYYLAGWVHIHSDNHTEAYRVWKEGHAAVPSCPILRRQASKRRIWDRPFPLHDDDGHKKEEEEKHACLHTLEDLVGQGAHSDGLYDPHVDLESFHVPSTETCCPALSLFDDDTQQRRLVWRSKNALLTPLECSKVVEEVQYYHNRVHGGKWSTVSI